MILNLKFSPAFLGARIFVKISGRAAARFIMVLTRRAASWAVFLLALLFYLPSVTGNFVWDDEDIIREDYVLRDASNALYVFTPQYWKRDFPGSEGRYRPLRALTFMAERKVWGEKAAGYHFDNALLHALAALVLFWLALALGLSVNRALLAGLLFAAHPAAVEAVAWVKNRTDLLAALFCASSLLLFIRSLEPAARRRLYGGAALLAFLAALLSKESAAVYPLLLLLYLVMVRREGLRRALLLCAPYLALAAALLVFVLSAMRPEALAAAPSLKWAFLSVSAYLRLMFAPLGLNLERIVVTPLELAGPALFGLYVYYAGRLGDRRGLFLALAAAAALLPLVDIRLVSSRPIAEQRLYFPLMFFCLSAAALLPSGRRWRYGAAGAGALLAALSLMRMSDWRDPVRLWEITVRQSPGSARAWLNLGLSYERQGRIADAAAEYEKSMALDPQAVQPRVNLAALLYKAGQGAEAAKLYREVLETSPASRQALLGLARLAVDRGDAGEARQNAEAALAANPADREALNAAGVACLMAGDMSCAKERFEAVLAMDPKDEKALYNMGNLARMGGDLAAAAGYFSELYSLNPGNLEAANNLAILHDMRGEHEKAIMILRQSLERSPLHFQSNYNLGQVYAGQGRDLEALAEYTRVLELKPDHARARAKSEELKRKLNK